MTHLEVPRLRHEPLLDELLRVHAEAQEELPVGLQLVDRVHLETIELAGQCQWLPIKGSGNKIVDLSKPSLVLIIGLFVQHPLGVGFRVVGVGG